MASRRNMRQKSFGKSNMAALDEDRSRSSNAGMDVSMEMELIRTILGEDVPSSVLLSCLNAADFDVSTAVNIYFSQITSHNANMDYRVSVRSSMPLTIHPFDQPGMLSNINMIATLTTGLQTFDTITPLNERFRVIRLRKRFIKGKSSDGVFLRNGDIVSLECNGMWLKASNVGKSLQWKPVTDTDDRNKFVVRGLSLGRVMTVNDPFFLTSYRWKDKEISVRYVHSTGIAAGLGMGLGSTPPPATINNAHRCFLGLDAVKP